MGNAKRKVLVAEKTVRSMTERNEKEKAQKQEPTLAELGAAVTMLNDKIMVKPIEKRASDILVESEEWKKDAQYGTVIAVGKGRIINGQIFPIDCKPGDVVNITKYGEDKEILGVQCKMIHAAEVHFISHETR